MALLSSKITTDLPSFQGLIYHSTEVEKARKCLETNLIIILMVNSILSGSMIIGFKAFLLPLANIYPDIYISIYRAMLAKNVQEAQKTQIQLEKLINKRIPKMNDYIYVAVMKHWFNEVNSIKMKISVGSSKHIRQRTDTNYTK